jgi:hypothetical protein
MSHNCLNCETELIKKTTESNNRFLAKKFCSPNCSRMYMKKNKIGWFSPARPTVKREKADFNFDKSTAYDE